MKALNDHFIDLVVLKNELTLKKLKFLLNKKIFKIIQHNL